MDSDTQKQNSYICREHIVHISETPMSPCRGKPCKICKKRKVDGYTNPNHVTNPFGYLYLFPEICVKCAIRNKKCMWCIMMKKAK